MVKRVGLTVLAGEVGAALVVIGVLIADRVLDRKWRAGLP